MKHDDVLVLLEENNPVPSPRSGGGYEETDVELLALVDERSRTMSSSKERTALKRVPEPPTDPPATRRVPGPALALAVVVVAIGVVAAVVQLAPRIGGDNTPPGAVHLPEGWSRVPDPAGVFDDVTLAAVVEGGPGYVAVGSDRAGRNGMVWSSSDGSTWELVATGDQFLDAYPIDIVAAGPGLVAVGHDHLLNTAAVWTSTDGEVWIKVALDPAVMGEVGSLQAVAAGPSGIVAVGEYGPSRSARQAAAWQSLDGTSWTRSDLPGRGVPLDVTSTPDGFVAVGHVGELRQMAIWASPDGVEWTLAWNEYIGDPSAVTFGAAGLVAIGEDFSGDSFGLNRSTTLYSPDGGSWSREANLPGGFISVTFADGEYVAVGGDSATGAAIIARSGDGRRWTTVTEEPAFAGSRMTDVVADGSVLIAVGRSGLRNGAVWTFNPD